LSAKVGDGWQTVYTDGDAYTTFDWARTGGDTSSEATVTWELHDEQPGTYRVVYNELAKHSLLGQLASFVKFTGISPSFQVQ
jgi:neutral ceramidase